MTPNDLAQIQALIDTAVQNAVSQLKDNIEQRAKVIEDSPVTPHQHNKYDSPAVSGGDLDGFPIDSATPTISDLEGKIRLYSSGGTYKLYVRLAQGWRSVTLT